jgi:hypothetical protein
VWDLSANKIDDNRREYANHNVEETPKLVKSIEELTLKGRFLKVPDVVEFFLDRHGIEARQWQGEHQRNSPL